MALASILFTELRKDGIKLEALTRELFLDVTISERPIYASQVTKNPVEDGSFVNDHVIEMPDTLALDGLISDSPIGVLSGVRDIIDKGFGSTSRSKNAFSLLLDLKKNKTLVSIINGLTTYNNMIITQFAPARNRTTGQALRFTLTLQKVNKVESNIFKTPLANILDVHADTTDQIQSTADAGKQATKTTATKVQEDTSALWDLVEFAGKVP